MSDTPTLSELIGAVVILGGLGVTLWALVDDVWDLANVWRFGEIGGPRWISAYEHLRTNLIILAGWVCFLYVITVAIYLPSRTDQPAAELSFWVGWARIGFAVSVLVSQVNRRAGRIALQRLPLDAWERMLASMFHGVSTEEGTRLMQRLLVATTAGRQMGHAIANEAQLPVAVLDEFAEDKTLSPERRQAARDAVAALLDMVEHVKAYHTQLRSSDPTYTGGQAGT